MGINISQIVTLFGNLTAGEQHEVRNWFKKGRELSQYATNLPKINGEFPAITGVMTNMVQEFSTVWNELGEAHFQGKKLETFRQKINFGFIPQVVYGSYLAFLAREDLKAEQKPISVWLMEDLKDQVQEDLFILEGSGTHVAGSGAFGDSMDGIITVLTAILATGNPFKIPLAALTEANMVAQMTRFERSIPSRLLNKIETIFCSQENKELYEMNYEDTFKTKVTYKDGDKMQSRLKKKTIVGLECMNGSDLIWASPRKNFLQLTDLNTPGKITDVQRADYKVKVFGEFALAYDFWLDEALCISDTGGLARGLVTNHTRWYPEISTNPIV
jgi:hypothetical protein